MGLPISPYVHELPQGSLFKIPGDSEVYMKVEVGGSGHIRLRDGKMFTICNIEVIPIAKNFEDWRNGVD